MNRRRRERTQHSIQAQPKPLETYLSEGILTDLRNSFGHYSQKSNRRNEINRDNLKSIMENFGWLNKSNKLIEACIDEVITEKDGKKKETFTYEETLKVISEHWVKNNYMEEEFAELFAIFDKK